MNKSPFKIISFSPCLPFNFLSFSLSALFSPSPCPPYLFHSVFPPLYNAAEFFQLLTSFSPPLLFYPFSFYFLFLSFQIPLVSSFSLPPCFLFLCMRYALCFPYLWAFFQFSTILFLSIPHLFSLSFPLLTLCLFFSSFHRSPLCSSPQCLPSLVSILWIPLFVYFPICPFPYLSSQSVCTSPCFILSLSLPSLCFHLQSFYTPPAIFLCVSPIFSLFLNFKFVFYIKLCLTKKHRT